MEAPNGIQFKQVNKLANTILALLQSMVDLVPRLIEISMPKEDGSTTPISAQVINTRLEYGRPNKKQKFYHEGSFGGRSLKVQSLRAGGMKAIQEIQM